MSDDQLAQSQAPDGAHGYLSSLVGEWEGPTHTWFEPDKLADESIWHGTMRLILAGRFLLHEYTGSMQGQPLQGMAWYAYNLTTEVWEAAWIDTFHMGSAILFSSGIPDRSRFAVLGSYPAGPGQPDWGWRTEITLSDPDHITVTAYNILPTGEAYKAVETCYTRVAS